MPATQSLSAAPLTLLVLLLTLTQLIDAFSELKPHHYTTNLLKPFTGLPLPYTLSAHDKKLLLKGKSVISRDEEVSRGTEQDMNEIPQYHDSGANSYRRNRRAKIIQDIAAPPQLCMNKLLDYENYSKMVSLLKKFDIYDHTRLSNGTDITCARFEVGLLYLRLGYYLKQKYIPQYNTLTWTLDHSRDSDFDDNVGHWQVMSHPHKKNWSRVLLSTEAILPEWLPSFALNFIEKAALTESTGWLKRESEKAYKDIKKCGSALDPSEFTDVPHTYTDTIKSGNGGAEYIPHVPLVADGGGGGDGEVPLPSAATATGAGDGNLHGVRTDNADTATSFSKSKKLPSLTTTLKKKKINKIRVRHTDL